jgi:hypothetical protein
MISAIDELKGGIEWRSRGSASGEYSSKKRVYLKNLLDLILVCNEGRGLDLVKAAMNVGAAGATISQFTHIGIGTQPSSGISTAREYCSLVISEKQLGEILDALQKAGVFDASTHGTIITRPVPKACTYLGK